MNDPCNRTNTLYKIDKNTGLHKQFCLLVNHRTNVLVDVSGWLRPAWVWLAENKIQLPQTVLTSDISIFDPTAFMQVQYWFNPEADGFAPSRNPNWLGNDWHKDVIHLDAKKVEYVSASRRWTRTSWREPQMLIQQR